MEVLAYIDTVVKQWGTIIAVATLLFYGWKFKEQAGGLKTIIEEHDRRHREHEEVTVNVLKEMSVIHADMDKLVEVSLEHSRKLAVNDATHESITDALKEHVRANADHDTDVRADLAVIKDRLSWLSKPA